MPRTTISSRAFEIREAALTLFAERGYHGTSMNDIAEILNIQAPSLYNHLRSKQELLQEVMVGTMETLLADYHQALGTTDDVSEQLRRAVEAHVRYHCRHRREVAIGNRDIPALEEPVRSRVLDLRREYAEGWEALIQRGSDLGAFRPGAVRLAAWAILEMGIAVAWWYRPDGPMSEAVIAYHYGDMALRVVNALPAAPGGAFPVTEPRAAPKLRSGS